MAGKRAESPVLAIAVNKSQSYWCLLTIRRKKLFNIISYQSVMVLSEVGCNMLFI